MGPELGPGQLTIHLTHPLIPGGTREASPGTWIANLLMKMTWTNRIFMFPWVHVRVGLGGKGAAQWSMKDASVPVPCWDSRNLRGPLYPETPQMATILGSLWFCPVDLHSLPRFLFWVGNRGGPAGYGKELSFLNGSVTLRGKGLRWVSFHPYLLDWQGGGKQVCHALCTVELGWEDNSFILTLPFAVSVQFCAVDIYCGRIFTNTSFSRLGASLFSNLL